MQRILGFDVAQEGKEQKQKNRTLIRASLSVRSLLSSEIASSPVVSRFSDSEEDIDEACYSDEEEDIKHPNAVTIVQK